MWLRVTKELLREGPENTCLASPGGAGLKGRGGRPQLSPGSQPHHPRDWSLTFPEGTTLRQPVSFTQPGRGEPQTALCVSSPALALHGRPFLSFLSPPLTLAPSRATTFKVRSGACHGDGPTLRLSLCTDLAPAPPARVLWKPQRRTPHGKSPPGVPLCAQPSL